MTDLTPNAIPKGQHCGTCRFAGTHTSGQSPVRTLVKCQRFPPQRLSNIAPIIVNAGADLHAQKMDTAWPVLTWDDWCGEWKARL